MTRTNTRHAHFDAQCVDLGAEFATVARGFCIETRDKHFCKGDHKITEYYRQMTNQPGLAFHETLQNLIPKFVTDMFTPDIFTLQTFM